MMPSLLWCSLVLSVASARPTLEELVAVVSVRSAVVSPDGATLAYVTDKSGALELWTLRLDGKSAPQQRTSQKQEVSGVAWSPDSKTLVFEMDEGGNERTDLFQLVAAGGTPTRLTSTTQLAEAGVEFSRTGDRMVFLADPGQPFRFNVNTRVVATGKDTRHTFETINVSHAVWRPDAKQIAATVSPDDQQGEVLLLDLVANTQRKLPPPQHKGMAAVVGYLPDGRLLTQATNALGFLQLATLDTTSGRYTFVGPGDWDLDDVDLAHNGAVLLSRNVHGVSEVLLLDRVEATPQLLWRGGLVGDVSLSADGKTATFVRETAKEPDGIFLWRAAGGASNPLVPVVPPDAGTLDLAALQPFSVETFVSFDGTKVDGFLMAPSHAGLGTPPPAVVMVHGGPNGQTRDAFSATAHVLSQAGFLVVSPNYRGSTGYGRAFEDLNNHDWGGGDLKDITSVVEQLAKAGRLDARRVGIMGGSYGGYMTLRAITAVPGVFAAAVDSYGMPDLVADYQITESRFGTWYVTEMGTPTTHPELFRDRSPIHGMDKVVTPLLVLQGANDTNVPKEESDLVVAALKKRKATVDYAVYPNEGHGFTRRENRLDAARRTVAWMLRHLGKTAAAPKR